MYKSKLQELCHRKHWSLPQYYTTKEGPKHSPRFATTVTVNGFSFLTPNSSRSTKESHNEAAMLALEHLSAPTLPPTEPPIISPSPKPPTESPVIVPPPGRPSEPLIVAAPPNPPAPEPTDDLQDICAMLSSLKSLQPKLLEEYESTEMRMAGRPALMATPPEECRAPLNNQISRSIKEDAPVRDVWHLSKNQLQMYAQKRNLPLPTYSSERDGPPHASRFKCKVTVDGQTFEGPDYCSTLKDAEHAAARVALLAMSSTEDQEAGVKDSGLYKNLLQELAQKEGYRLPVYETKGTLGRFPTFTSTVVIEGESFTGQPEKSKKQAEMGAAKVGYTTLIERKRNQISTSHCPSKVGSSFLSSPSTSSQKNAIPSISTNVSAGVNVHSNLTHLAKRANADGEVESTSHNNPSLPHEAASTIRKEGSLSNPLHSQAKNHALEESSSGLHSSRNGNMPTATASTLGCSVQVVISPPPGVIRVYPRALNMTLPEGSVVVISDENWIAVTGRADPS